jgi:hypothetical protein
MTDLLLIDVCLSLINMRRSSQWLSPCSAHTHSAAAGPQRGTRVT